MRSVLGSFIKQKFNLVSRLRPLSYINLIHTQKRMMSYQYGWKPIPFQKPHPIIWSTNYEGCKMNVELENNGSDLQTIIGSHLAPSVYNFTHGRWVNGKFLKYVETDHLEPVSIVLPGEPQNNEIAVPYRMYNAATESRADYEMRFSQDYFVFKSTIKMVRAFLTKHPNHEIKSFDYSPSHDKDFTPGGKPIVKIPITKAEIFGSDVSLLNKFIKYFT